MHWVYLISSSVLGGGLIVGLAREIRTGLRERGDRRLAVKHPASVEGYVRLIEARRDDPSVGQPAERWSLPWRRTG